MIGPAAVVTGSIRLVLAALSLHGMGESHERRDIGQECRKNKWRGGCWPWKHEFAVSKQGVQHQSKYMPDPSIAILKYRYMNKNQVRTQISGTF